MEKQSRIEKEEHEDKLACGTVTFPYLKGFSEIFKRMTSRHKVKTEFRPDTKVKELKIKAKTQLAEKKALYTPYHVSVKISFAKVRHVKRLRLGKKNAKLKSF